MTIKVVNKYKEPNHIYCGRGSALGNPFPLTSELDRDAVCDQYEEWFTQKVMFSESNSEFHNQLNFIYKAAQNGDVNLGCFCAPKRCHCETIKRYIDNKIQLLG